MHPSCFRLAASLFAAASLSAPAVFGQFTGEFALPDSSNHSYSYTDYGSTLGNWTVTAVPDYYTPSSVAVNFAAAPNSFTLSASSPGGTQSNQYPQGSDIVLSHTVEAASTISFDFTGSAPGGYFRVQVNGSDASPTGSSYTISLEANDVLAFELNAAGGFYLDLGGGLSFDGSPGTGSITISNFSVTSQSAVPEPSTYGTLAGLAALGAAFGVTFAKRRQRQALVANA